MILVGLKGNLLSNKEIDNRFKELSKKKRIFYVKNILEGVIGNPELMFDVVHLNNQGHQKMADKIYPILKMALNCEN